jgi:type I restriction enzyme S subunit
MKDSGVEWIGEIPETWGIVPLKFLGDFQNGISKGSEFFGHGLPFMNYGDVYKNQVTPLEVEGKVDSTDSERNQYSVLRGDIFFTRTSESKDDIGVSSTCLKSINQCVFSGFVIRFRFFQKTHLPEYSKYHFQTHWKKVFIESKMNIVTRSSLSQQVLGQVPVLIPHSNEQLQIVNFLDSKTNEIDDLVHLEQKKIDLLKEYRQSLISEVVTGKIKVTQ